MTKESVYKYTRYIITRLFAQLTPSKHAQMSYLPWLKPSKTCAAHVALLLGQAGRMCAAHVPRFALTLGKCVRELSSLARALKTCADELPSYGSPGKPARLM